MQRLCVITFGIVLLIFTRCPAAPRLYRLSRYPSRPRQSEGRCVPPSFDSRILWSSFYPHVRSRSFRPITNITFPKHAISIWRVQTEPCLSALFHHRKSSRIHQTIKSPVYYVYGRGVGRSLCKKSNAAAGPAKCDEKHARTKKKKTTLKSTAGKSR